MIRQTFGRYRARPEPRRLWDMSSSSLTPFLRPVRHRDLLRVWGAFLSPIVLLVLVLVAVRVFSPDLTLPDIVLWTLPVVLVLVSALLVAWSVRGWSADDLGFRRLGRRGLHLLWQVPVVLVLALTATAILGQILGLQPTATTEAEDDALGSSRGAVVVLVSYLLVGPVIEEVLIRRLTMSWIEDRLFTLSHRPRVAAAGAVVLSSVVFGLLHVVAPVMLWTFLMGIGCAVLTRWHRSLWGGLALHCTVNLLASTALVAAVFT